MKCLALIPARSGSKGLPDKNIALLKGRPLIDYSISAALESGVFDTVMVSTDSEKYAALAEECGATVPFLRTAETAKDTSSTWDTVREVLQKYEELGCIFDNVIVLQPTSPLRTADDIRKLFEMKEKLGANNAVSVTEVEHPVQWCFRLPEDYSLDEMAKSPYNYTRRQDLEKHYRENGAIYMVDAHKIRNAEYDFYADKCIAYIMPQERSIDIDTKLDFVITEAMLNQV